MLNHRIHDIIILMKYMIYSSKYEAILKMLLLYVVDFILFKIRDRPYVFLVGGGGGGAVFFSQQLKLELF